MVDFFISNPASNDFQLLGLNSKIGVFGYYSILLKDSFKPSLETATATTLPYSSTIGPPLLPGCNAASVEFENSYLLF